MILTFNSLILHFNLLVARYTVEPTTKSFMKRGLYFVFLVKMASIFGQNIPNYRTNFPNIPSVSPPQPINTNQMIIFPQEPKKPTINDYFQTQNNNQIQQQNERLLQEAERDYQRREQQRQQILQEAHQINQKSNYPSDTHVKYSLPITKKNEAQFYHEAFKKIINQNDENFSLKENVFLIENAFFENKKSYEEFNQEIKKSAEFILQKIKEENYNLESNETKNFMLFQFFAQNLKIKKGQLHKAFKYDFEDYNGEKDYTKMFVTKLLKTGSGQCHSMPLLYLILAEEIGAEAFLVLSPNHSFIRFYDDENNLQSVELTNGMLSNDSYVLQSGVIKSEGLSQGVYMKNLNKKELKSHLISDLILGYIQKFGNDEFVNQANEEALKINPKNINPKNISSQMIKANYNTKKFEFVMQQLKINPRDNNELQNIRFYPKAVKLLNETNAQYTKIDDLGFSQMPEEVYQNWLKKMKNEDNKQISEHLKMQMKEGLEKFKKEQKERLETQQKEENKLIEMNKKLKLKPIKTEIKN
jgi:hypothetical protein